MDDKIYRMYELLYQRFGPQHWWPGETPFEVMVGAVLTQNTNWANVEKAIGNLKERGWLSPQALHSLPLEAIAEAIRPSGYFNVKAKRLKALVDFLWEEYQGDLERMFAEDTDTLRGKLLSIPGLGPETVDSILLYAGNKLAFVVDAYTKRIFSRHGLCFEDVDYHQLQSLITESIPKDVSLYNEFHALLVKVGKEYCKKRQPLCANCPLAGL